MKSKLGILLSGRGSNFGVIAHNVLSGRLDCEIALVFSNKPQAPGLAHARSLGLATASIASAGVERSLPSIARSPLSSKLTRSIGSALLSYMRLLSGHFVSQFAGRILNIHPSLLPAFPGLDAQYQALAHGVKVTGCTVHFVDHDLDSGPILMQAAVPVLDGDTVDTLSARILAEEHRIYSEAIAWVLRGDYRIENRRVLKTC